MKLIDGDVLVAIFANCPEGDFSSAEVARTIDNAPTIDAAPVRHATWEIENIPDQDDDGKPFMVTFSRCSVCGKRVYFNFERTKYCSDCGAKMDLAKEEPT